MAEIPIYTLLGTRFLEARWIWPFGEVKANGHVLFRSRFELEDPKLAAWLFIAVESCARVFLNGKEILRTSSLSYPGQHYYEFVELGKALKDGINELAILAWYIGVPSGASCPKDPGLLAEIVSADGSVLDSSGVGWSTLPLDAWSSQHRRSKWLNLDLIEILDFRRLPNGFPMLEVDAEFSTPEATSCPGARFVSVEPRQFSKPEGETITEFAIIEQGIVEDNSSQQAIPSMAVLAEDIVEMPLGIENGNQFSLQPTSEGKAWSLVLDLRRYEKGLPRFSAKGDPGTVIDLSWYETRPFSGGRTILASVHATDRYILSGRTDDIVPEEWKCGRFLQLTFRNIKTGLKISDLRWESLHYPLEPRVEISASSSTLERILEISLRSVALCMHDNIMDCPWRERRQWIGDVQRIALINYYGFGEYALPRAVLKQHVRLQDISGRMWVCLPIREEFPSQSMEWLRAVLEYQEFSGDQTLVDEVADNIELLHRWFLKCRDERDLFFLHTPPAINWMDNCYGSILTGDESVMAYQFQTPFLVLNLRYLLFLDDVSACMKQLGREEVSRRASQERKRLASVIEEHFLVSETGLFRDSANKEVPVTVSELGHALAICCDLPNVDSANLWDRFEKYADSNPEVIRSTPFGKYHTHEALGKLGRPEAIMEDILSNWGPMVDADSDTTWERFDGSGSQCHGWAGIPVVGIMRHVLRIGPKQASKATVKGIAGIDWIKGQINR